ncbi:MAG TPA: DUF4402 domain-containing protein [Gemmatimonadales bacterium]|nr:DUF4402 domain-containing protein [Gemmatimonadales bacterium]
MTLLCALTPSVGHGQVLTVTGAHNLTFGTVLPGVSSVISRTDPANAGRFNIFSDQQGNQIRMTFTLPAAMIGPAGAQMPLVFGAADAGFSATQNINGQVAFDPRTPFNQALPNNGRCSVFLGGRANPATNQRAGAYAGTITLTVTVLQ